MVGQLPLPAVRRRRAMASTGSASRASWSSGDQTPARSNSYREQERQRCSTRSQAPRLRPIKPPQQSATDSSAALLASLGGADPACAQTARLNTDTPLGFVKRSSSEDCLKCMLKLPHKKCQGHKYIRIGGGYRHSYWMVKAMMEAIELERQRQLVLKQRLDAIQEKGMKAVKTYIRTKSGRLIERIVFMSEDDYKAFLAGGDAARAILGKYLSMDEAKNLESWDKEEQKAVTIYVRTKSGRRVAKVIYMSKSDFEKMQRGEIDSKTLLAKYVKTGETLDGWEATKMVAVKTFVRTKSGRLIEKTIMMSKEDFEKMEEMKRLGLDTSAMLAKYMSLDDGETVEGWQKQPESGPMKVVKVMVRTKSGRLVEKTILMTEAEYAEFQKSGGDLNFLKRFLPLGKDDVIEGWEKASTVYSGGSDDDAIQRAAPGTRIIGKDGVEYDIVVDPLTGKKYKKKVVKRGDSTLKKGKIGKGVIMGAAHDDPNEKGMTQAEKEAYRAGKRREGSDSEYSYTSHVSAGGTRHVMRRRRRADGTYSAAESYDSGADAAGRARRQQRRATRKAAAVKELKKRMAKGKRGDGSDSDYSYRSVISAGGTRHVKRRRKRADGTYSAEHSYHSSQDEEGEKRRKNRRKQRVDAIRKGKRNPGSDSDYSYRSVVSAGGTRHVKRRRRRADGTYSAEHSYHSDDDADGRERRRRRRQERQKAYKGGKRNEGSDSDYSYRSVVSAGGTRHVKRRRKRADGTYSAEESYHSSRDGDGEARRRRRRRDRKHAGSANSYYSVVSAGGTRHVRRRRRLADGTYGASESYHSSDSDLFDKKRKKKKRHGSDSEHSYFSEVSAGGTRRKMKRKRIRDAAGNVVGHGEAVIASSSDSDSSSSYESVSDGKGGRKMVKKEKKSKKGKGQGKKGGGPDGNLTDFSGSLLSTDPDDEPDFSKMTEKQKKEYFEAKAKRQAEREKKRREKYGDKYDEMMAKHQIAKDATKKALKGKKGGGPTGSMTDFSDDLLSTDSENEPDLSKMTEEEKKKYFEAKAKRQAEREKKRREKYGDKYDEMMEKHQLAKEAQKAAKSMVTYGKGSRFKDGEKDERGMGLGHDEWGTKGKKGSMDATGHKKKGARDSDEESIYEYARDADGNILRDKDGKPIMKKIGTRKKGAKGDDDDEFEYKYDAAGNLVRQKKGEDSDGDYFEVMPDGTIRLKAGKKKIDISKLTDEELRRLGLDPSTMSKEEMARILKERFGDDIEIHRGGKKVGLKHIEDYGSDVDTDDLANDSDLDTSTLVGQKRVRVLMKRGGAAIQEQLKKLIEDSMLVDEQHTHPEERDASIDFLTHYQLVNPNKIEPYARAFVVEDDDKDGVVYPREAKLALEGIPSIQHISKKQLDYILKVLDIDRETKFTFRMFAVMSALTERVTQMDQYCRDLLEICNTMDIERKMRYYRSMFYCNVEGDRDPNHIRASSLQIELIAGGLSYDQQQFIMSRMKPNSWQEINFLDYLAYIPLFMSMHDNMCVNPLDMSNTKYLNRPVSTQRDMNPLGYPLKKDTNFIKNKKASSKQLQQQAQDILAGKVNADDDDKNREIYSKFKKLPDIIGSQSYPATAKRKPPLP